MGIVLVGVLLVLLFVLNVGCVVVEYFELLLLLVV